EELGRVISRIGWIQTRVVNENGNIIPGLPWANGPNSHSSNFLDRALRRIVGGVRIVVEYALHKAPFPTVLEKTLDRVGKIAVRPVSLSNIGSESTTKLIKTRDKSWFDRSPLGNSQKPDRAGRNSLDGFVASVNLFYVNAWV